MEPDAGITWMQEAELKKTRKKGIKKNKKKAEGVQGNGGFKACWEHELKGLLTKYKVKLIKAAR